jgi:hypothetical protein
LLPTAGQLLHSTTLYFLFIAANYTLPRTDDGMKDLFIPLAATNKPRIEEAYRRV